VNYLNIKNLLCFLLLLGWYFNFSAQTLTATNFLGLNPSITIEPFYEKGEFDVNVCPLVYQRVITRRIDIRLNSIVNLGIRKNGNALSHLGLELAVPIFFKKKENKNETSKGFYCAPLLSVSANQRERQNNFGFWAEPGYHLLFENNFALSFGLQVGATYIKSALGDEFLGSHFGGKVIFGKWF